jgi:flagellar protein FlbD
MITLTRLNGGVFAINADLIERIDVTPDTVITLVDGSKYLVSEPLDEIIARIREFRASIVAQANLMMDGAPSSNTHYGPALRVVPAPEER